MAWRLIIFLSHKRISSYSLITVLTVLSAASSGILEFRQISSLEPRTSLVLLRRTFSAFRAGREWLTGRYWVTLYYVTWPEASCVSLEHVPEGGRRFLSLRGAETRARFPADASHVRSRPVGLGLTLPRLWWWACSARAELRDWAETKRGRRRAPAQPTSKHQTSRPARGQSRGQLSSPVEPKIKQHGSSQLTFAALQKTIKMTHEQKGTNQKRKN